MRRLVTLLRWIGIGFLIVLAVPGLAGLAGVLSILLKNGSSADSLRMALLPFNTPLAG